MRIAAGVVAICVAGISLLVGVVIPGVVIGLVGLGLVIPVNWIGGGTSTEYWGDSDGPAGGGGEGASGV